MARVAGKGPPSSTFSTQVYSSTARTSVLCARGDRRVEGMSDELGKCVAGQEREEEHRGDEARRARVAC
jgi:hypothetical protein